MGKLVKFVQKMNQKVDTYLSEASEFEIDFLEKEYQRISREESNIKDVAMRYYKLILDLANKKAKKTTEP